MLLLLNALKLNAKWGTINTSQLSQAGITNSELEDGLR